MNPTLIILSVGCCVAMSCALVGSFLVLRKMALLGDAISHSVLPGIAIAFLLTGQRSPLPMILGAGFLGVFTVFLVELFNRTRRLHEDAAIGVVFPALFSIGIILISRYTAQVDLDLDCVLYGEIAYTPWDIFLIQDKSWGPKALWITGGTLLLNIFCIALFYKEFKLASFDKELTAALGFSPIVIHYLLMSIVSITVVSSFESVGAILVVAMLVVPPATAYLLTDNLKIMIFLALSFGVASTILGYLSSHWLDCSIAGAIATVAGILFSLTFLFSPSQGLLGKLFHQQRVRKQLLRTLLLQQLERRAGKSSITDIQQAFLWSSKKTYKIIHSLVTQGLIQQHEQQLQITSVGLQALKNNQQP